MENEVITSLKDLISYNISQIDIFVYTKTIEKFKSIFYHFLDGFINEESGYNKENIIDFLLYYDILFNFFKLNKTIERSIKYIKYIDSNSFQVTNLIDTKVKNHNLKTITRSEIKEVFRYSIYAIGRNSHQTTIVNFIKNNKFHLLSFNSGFGLDNHEFYDNKFLPYYGIYIDLEDNDDFYRLNIINVMNSVFILGDFYNKLLEINDINKRYLQRYIFWLNDIISYLTNMFEINENIKDIPIDARFTSEYNYIKYEKNIIDLEDLYNQVIKSKQDYELSISKSKHYEITWNIDKIFFYNILIELLDSLEWNNFDISIYKPENYNFKYKDFKDDDIKVPEIVINKNILHYNEIKKKLYIKQQESGSCTWYSIYWALIFYFILIEENSDLYINFVKYLNKMFYFALISIFSDDSFKKYFANDPYNHEIKNICNKLIDINILDKSILLNQKDFLFNVEWKCDFKYIIQVESDYNNKLVKMKEYFNINFITDDTIIINKIFNFLLHPPYNDTNEEKQIMIYLLYKYNKEKNLDFFSNVEFINIDQKLKEINIVVERTTLKFKKNYRRTRTEENELKQIPDLEIPELNITLIQNSYEQLNDIFKFEKNFDYKLDILPGYFNYYYCWVLYINNYINDLKDDNEIYSFIIFAHKLNLTYQIISSFNNFINGIYLYFEDPIKNPSEYTNIETISLGEKIYKEIILKLFNKKFNDCKIDYINFRLNFNLNSSYDKEYKYNQNPYKPPILKKQPNQIYDNIIFINQFMNMELGLFEKKINNNFRSLKNYNKLIIFLLNNPKYINIAFNNIQNQNDDIYLFILLNLHIIQSEKLIYDKILYYFCSLYNFNNNDTNILCLLLLNKKIDNINKYGFFINNSSYTMTIFKSKLGEIKDDKKNKTFYQGLINSNLSDISQLNLILKYNKFFKNAELISNNEVKYNNINYKLIDDYNQSNPGNFLLLFNITFKGIYLYGTKDETTRLIIINNSDILEFDIKNFATSYIGIKFKINDIYFNLNKILKFDDYKYLSFAYLIPSNYIHMIYNENNIYKVIYFINKDISMHEILFKHTIESGIQIYEINNNNLLFPQLNSDFKKYSDLCLNFGVNNYNILFINNHNEKYAYNFNDKSNKLFNFNKNDFLKKKLNVEKLSLNKLSLLKENEFNIIKFIQDDQNRIIVKLKNKGYSIGKILLKINECVINDTNIEKYKTKFQNILDEINHSFIDDIDFFNKSNFNELLTC